MRFYDCSTHNNECALPCFLNHSFLWNSDSFCSSLNTANVKSLPCESLKHFIQTDLNMKSRQVKPVQVLLHYVET